MDDNSSKRKLPVDRSGSALDAAMLLSKKMKICDDCMKSGKADELLQSFNQDPEMDGKAENSQYDDGDDDEGCDISFDHEEEEESDTSDHEEDEKCDNTFDHEEDEFSFKDNSESEVLIKSFLDKEEEFEDWLTYINATAYYKGDKIGYTTGFYVRRDLIRANFWEQMEEPSRELSELAFEIFERYGTLKKSLEDHRIQKGTGVWSTELDSGPLFMIDRVMVYNDFREKGLGRALTDVLIRRAAKLAEPLLVSEADREFFEMMYGPQEITFLCPLVAPGFLWTDINKEMENRPSDQRRNVIDNAHNLTVSFYRALGFRRVGASSWFGFSMDPSHRSHKISPVEDFDPKSENQGDTESESEEEADDVDRLDSEQLKIDSRLAHMKVKLPLHHAVLTRLDSHCVSFFQKFDDGEEAEWCRVDSSGMNLLHVAASKYKLQTIQWLLENADAGGRLSNSRNINGFTPLEKLQELLEAKRSILSSSMITANVSDKFTGFSANEVDCLAALLRIPFDPATAEIRKLRLKYGCTCGECSKGFLSPRMRLSLQTEAEMMYDTMDFDIDDGEMWCLGHDDIIAHVRPALRQNFTTNKSLREGFANLFNLAASCLRSGDLPTTDNVLRKYNMNDSEWPPVTRNYLNWHNTLEGKIQPVLMSIFEYTRNQDEFAGDGWLKRILENQYSALTPCRNDHEFVFVARRCGIPLKDTWFSQMVGVN